MKNNMSKLFIFIAIISLSGCKNRDINEGEEFRLRAIKDNFNNAEFARITVDGVEYLMMERDNNNPHEGFGFMAFRANKLIEKQDTVLSYLRAMQVYQNKIYARMYNIAEEEAQLQFEQTFEEYLSKERKELLELEKQEMKASEK